MSVYDCEPPQLDCEIPPPDEEIGKRRDDFDLEDEEITSYSMNLKNTEHSVITSNALHLYDSSPPPVDDFFVPKDDYIDELEIPDLEYPSSPPKNINDDETEVLPNSSESVHSFETTKVKDTSHEDVGVITFNDGPIIDDKSTFKESVTSFVLEDLHEDDIDYEDNNKTNVNDCTQESPKIEPTKAESFSIDDDDFDNFNDFEQAIPIDRHVDQHINMEAENNEPSEVQFEADFSAFETNFENEFQSFSQGHNENFTTNIIENKDVKVFDDFNGDDDDDDDFGDFNDFTQAPAPIITHEPTNEMPKNSIQLTQQTLKILNDSEVKSILGEMFPVNQQVMEETTTYTAAVKKDDDVNMLNDVESTLALTYEYKDSSTNHILIKALGIDERNILFGQQWASSNMPRFASDLSFNPLEPAKFATSSTGSYKNNNSNSNSSTVHTVMSSKTKELEPENIKELPPHPQQPDIIPEFDWNVAGLTNPLDGKQNNTLKPNVEEPAVMSYDLSVFDSLPSKSVEPIPTSDVDNTLNNKHIWQSERFDVPNTVVRERTIKLPETHIFTPVKSISPVAREVSRESSPIENEKPRSIVIKEYHDIEYSLESSKKNEIDNDFGDFNDFQSATTSNVSSQPSILVPTTAITTLEPLKVNEISDISNSAVINDLKVFTANVPTTEVTSKYDVFAEFTKTLEPQPLDNMSIVEDDFADFQAAPTIIPQTTEKPLYKQDSSITLSPSRLVNNLQKLPELSQKTMSTWMNDTLDSDEISRIEAAFPKCKVDNSKKKVQEQIINADTTQKDDDEWCDFQSVSQSSNIILSHKPPTIPPNQSYINATLNDPKTLTNNSDTSDWSDFVSVKPSINTSQFLSKPNFSSWNQSVGKPYVNHTTSFLSSNNNYSNNFYDPSSFYSINPMSENRKGNRQQQQQQPPMTITNNFNYNNFDRPDVSNNVPPYQMSNGISTILPDLQFALPKTLVNLSRGSGSDTTKK